MIFFDSKAMPHQIGPSLAPLANRLIRAGKDFIFANGSIICPDIDKDKAQMLLDSVYKVNEYIAVRRNFLRTLME